MAPSPTILLAEDSELTRRLTRELLEEAGYNVLEGANGAEALRVATAYPGPIHLLVSDWDMPVLDGGALVSRLRTLRPGVRVMVVSGWVPDLRALPEDAILLDKPTPTGLLLDTVQKVLARPLA